MNIIIINTSDVIFSRIKESLEREGHTIQRVIQINNIPGLTSISNDSLLIVGENYFIDESIINAKSVMNFSNSPIIFLTDDLRYKKAVALDDFNIISLNCLSYLQKINRKVADFSDFKVKRFPATVGKLYVDFEKRICRYDSLRVRLTKTQISIIYFIMVSDDHHALIEDLKLVFEFSGKIMTRATLSSHIRNIKIRFQDTTGEAIPIKSDYGWGYFLEK